MFSFESDGTLLPRKGQDNLNMDIESLIYASYTFRIPSTFIKSLCVPHDVLENSGVPVSMRCTSLAQVSTVSIQTWFFIFCPLVNHCLVTLAGILRCLPRYGPERSIPKLLESGGCVFLIGALKNRR